MTQTTRSRRRPAGDARSSPRPPGAAALGAAIVALALLGGGWSAAGAGPWTLRLEPMVMDVYGHDQHVLNVFRPDTAGPISLPTEAVLLDTDSSFAYRGELQRAGSGDWGVGLDFFWIITGQSTPPLAEAVGAGGLPIIFEAGSGSGVALNPGEVAFYRVLEDTDVAAWTVDLYVFRTVAERPGSRLDLRLGLRAADFDNDYRAVVGVEGVNGFRIDASSNYSLMLGPLVGLEAEWSCGKHLFETFLGQSIVLGSDVELSNRSRFFVGPFVAEPTVTIDESFRATHDVAIPISELRLRWSYRFNDRFTAGLGIQGAAWWDVPVPPRAIPGGGDLHENTLLFAGLFASLGVTF